MEQRGRKSSAEISVISADGIATIRRPEPPPELNEAQAAEWMAVVNRLPAEWFGRETHGLLEMYCQHVVSARRVAAQIARLEQAERFDVETLDQLHKMHERQSRAASSLATRMRLTQQSTYSDKKSKSLPNVSRKPWQS